MRLNIGIHLVNNQNPLEAQRNPSDQPHRAIGSDPLALAPCRTKHTLHTHQPRRAHLIQRTPLRGTTTTLLPHHTHHPKRLPLAPYLSALRHSLRSSLPLLRPIPTSPRSPSPGQLLSQPLRRRHLSRSFSTRPLRPRLSQTPKPPSQNPRVKGLGRTPTTENRRRRIQKATAHSSHSRT